MSTATNSTSAWFDAERACFEYLVTGTGSREGKDAFIGDQLSEKKGNLWTFILSGGPEQVQNYQLQQNEISNEN